MFARATVPPRGAQIEQGVPRETSKGVEVRETGRFGELLNVRRPAVAAGAAVVFLTDVLEQAERLPVGAQRELEVLRERLREDLRVVDRDLVAQLVADARQPLDRVQRVAVPARLRRVRVVVVV